MVPIFIPRSILSDAAKVYLLGSNQNIIALIVNMRAADCKPKSRVPHQFVQFAQNLPRRETGRAQLRLRKP